MGIGSFLAGAGQIGATAEDFVNKREVQRAARAEAQARQLELARTERYQNLRLSNSLADTSPYATLRMGSQLPLVEGEFPEQPPATLPAAGVKPPAAGVKPPVTSVPQKRMFAGVEVPYYDKNAPERLGVDPNASDFTQVFGNWSARNDLRTRLNKLGAEVGDITGGVLRPFLPQDAKGKSVEKANAAKWYRSSFGVDYFARNPEMVAVAEKDPVGFFKSVMTKPIDQNFRMKGVKDTTEAEFAKAPSTSQAATEDLKQYANVPWSAVRDRVANIESVGYDTLAYDRGNRNLTGVRAPQPVTTMTIGQVLNFQRNQMRAATKGFRGSSDVGSTGVGQYQFESNTLEENAKKAFGKDYKNVQFTPNNQEVLAETLWNAVRGNPERLANTWGAFGGKKAGQTQTQSAGVDQTGEAQAPARRLAASDIINADPDALSLGIQQNLQMRDEMVRQARLLQQAGLGNQYDQMRMQIMQLDNSMVGLQGAQGVQELLRYSDPSRIGAVYSLMDGGKNQIQFQRRNDGTFNMLANGKPVQQGLTKQQIVQDYMMATDASYRQSEIESRRKANEMILESQLTTNQETAKGLIQAASAQGVATINAGAQIQIKGMDGKQFTATNMGDGTALIASKDGREVFRYDVSSPDPEIIPAGPTMTRAAGGPGPVKSVSVG